MGSIPQVSVLQGSVSQNSIVEYIHTLFENNAANYGSKVAIIFRDLETEELHKLTYSELDIAANRLARSIIKQINDRRGSPNSDGDWVIAVSLAPSDALILTLLAIWKTRAAYLPIDKCAPPSRVKHIVSESSPTLIITEENNCNEINDSLNFENTVCFRNLDSYAATLSGETIRENEILKSKNKAIAIVLYTSGSTGVPKGVRIPHSAILNRLSWQWREFPYENTELVCVFKTALTFVDAVSEIWGPLMAKDPKTVLVIPRKITKDPERLIAILEEFKVHRLVLVPSLLRAMLMYLKLNYKQNGPQLLSSLKLWVCSGEPLPQSLALEFLDHFKSLNHILCNFYGSTEVMGDVTYYMVKSNDDIMNFDNKIPIGRPLDNTMVHLLDKNLNPVPIGEIGEIYASGLNLADGYVNGRDPLKFILNPLTNDPVFKRLYRTGDFGKIIKNVIVYEGRTDSQIKVRGHRVDLAEIEGVLIKVNGILRSSVLCYKPGEVDQAVVAYVSLDSDCKNTPQDIENELMKHLPSYSVPQVLVIDNIPLLVNGKVDRQTLLKRYGESSCNGIVEDIDLCDVEETKHAAAKILLKTVSSVLGSSLRAKLTLDSNFYQLGGNSLNSVYTVTKLKDIGFIIGITDFVTSETLRQVVERMVSEEDADKKTLNGDLSYEYVSEIMSENHKSDVYRIITDSFYEKADLEMWIEPRILPEDYLILLDTIWTALTNIRLSFIVRDKNSKVIGVSLNFDVNDEPAVSFESKLQIVFEFLEFMESSVREKYLPKNKGEVLHSFMMGTDQSLSAAENVSVIQFMEEEEMRLAKDRGFSSIFTTNSSPLTQQLGTDIFGYKVMKEYRVNQYVAPDGSKPFGKAPDSQTVSVSWKTLTG